MQDFKEDDTHYFFLSLGAEAKSRKVILGGARYLLVRDVIMLGNGSPDTQKAFRAWAEMSVDVKTLLAPNIRKHQFPGEGNRPVYVINMRGAVQLLAMLKTEKPHIMIARGGLADTICQVWLSDLAQVRETQHEISPSVYIDESILDVNDLLKDEMNLLLPMPSYDKKMEVQEVKSTFANSINFDEIIPGSQVRYVIIDNQPYFSIRDTIMVTCGKTSSQACTGWSDFRHKNELKEYIKRHQFPGVGSREVDVISLNGLLQLVMMLPGQQARTYRLGFTNILMRYLEGDSSLCAEIQSNNLIGALNSYAHVAGGIIKEMTTNSTYQPAKVCFIYCTFSMAFPGYVKIGRSQDVDKRVASLNTGCAPLPHTIVAMTPTLNPLRDEKWTHAHFRAHRKEGEFFEVSAEAVQDFFDRKINPRFVLEKEEAMAHEQCDLMEN